MGVHFLRGDGLVRYGKVSSWDDAPAAEPDTRLPGRPGGSGDQGRAKMVILETTDAHSSPSGLTKTGRGLVCHLPVQIVFRRKWREDCTNIGDRLPFLQRGKLCCQTGMYQFQIFIELRRRLPCSRGFSKCFHNGCANEFPICINYLEWPYVHLFSCFDFFFQCRLPVFPKKVRFSGQPN
jgi:hypothetical protein